MNKSKSYKFWREKLKCARHVVAPMVDQSELAWRLLSRKYGAELCYTPMLHASVFVKDARYRKENLLSCEEDRPLIVQFCANDPSTFLEAALLAQDHCDAIDLNLGCPQTIAKRGHYGAFLQEEWDLLEEMVRRVHNEINIPITCKIRIFPEIERTVQYAQLLEAAGCQLLTVHGRTRDQKGPYTGLASWSHIKAVKQNVNIPVFSNGNIQYLSDVIKCFEETGVDGVMVAEGNLHNPALFRGTNPSVWEMGLEYFEFVRRFPCQLSFIRGHIFKICHHCLTMEENKEIRRKFAMASNVEEFTSALLELKQKYGDNTLLENEDSLIKYGLPFPPWICQPYVRPPPVEALSPASELMKNNLNSDSSMPAPKRPVLENADRTISRKKLKKLKKNPDKQFGARRHVFEKCSICLNPKGIKCSFGYCKACCRDKTSSEVLDCVGHRFYFFTKKQTKATLAMDDSTTNSVFVNEKENSFLEGIPSNL